MKPIVKLIAYILAVIVIFSGIVCGIWAYKIITNKSYIEGDLSGIENVYKSTDFYFKTNQLAMYEDEENENLYLYEIDLIPVENFNGITKTYEVVFNKHEIINPTIKAGKVEFTEELEFLDVNNQVLKQSRITVLISFLANKTKLKVAIEVSDKAYITQYFNNNSFELSIREVNKKWERTH